MARSRPAHWNPTKNTFIFQATLSGQLDALHVKWLGGPITAPLPPL